MEDYEAYGLYNDIKLHLNNQKFKWNRDFPRKISVKKFEEYIYKNRCIGVFKRLANHSSPANFIIANIYDKDRFPPEWVNKEGEEKYKKWLYNLENIIYNFQVDIDYIKKTSSNISSIDVVLSLVASQQIQYETGSILIHLLFDIQDIKESVLPSYGMRIYKYFYLLDKNIDEFSLILKNNFIKNR